MKRIAVGVVLLLVGAGVGFLVGHEVASRFWVSRSHILAVSSGAQAHGTLVLLERNDEATLRKMLNDEIDGSLAYLDGLEGRDPILQRLADQLHNYRDRHPRVQNEAPGQPSRGDAPQ